jgi:AAA domain, putative AbiEii toxin, Type IV TA system
MVTEAAEAESETGEAGERPLLRAVEARGWPGLGGDVRLELGDRRTVLVGKNGAGKSLLVDGLYRAARAAVLGWTGEPLPLGFRCEVSIPGDPPIAYEYHARASDTDERTEGEPRREWDERCWRLDSDEDIWRISASKIVFGTGGALPFAPGVGLLRLQDLPIPPPSQVAPIASLLRGVRLVAAGVLRRSSARREILVAGTRTNGSRVWRSGRDRVLSGPDRVSQLAQAVTTMWERDRERYEELRQILLDLGLVHDVTVKVYEDPAADRETGKRRDFASVLFDGINLGFQSDGTLRVAEIVWKLLQPSVSCLLIEGPETEVHPGLLAKLLALFDSYSLDRQIVVSTHSPEVVNWCTPQDLRLVVRDGSVTSVHSLEPADMENVLRYLRDDGILADFVYRRERT